MKSVFVFGIILFCLGGPLKGATNFILGIKWIDLNEKIKLGYVMGTIDTYTTRYWTHKDPNLKFVNCIPESVSGNQIVLIVDKYITDNPQKLNIYMNVLIGEALWQAFPCKDSD